jgi:hypothetical protein
MKLFYYEAKTGLIFDTPPRERNVYYITDTPDNREKVRTLEGKEKIEWLEKNCRGRFAQGVYP